MAEPAVIVEDELEQHEGYAAPFCRAVGNARSRVRSSTGFSLWFVTGDLSEGTEIFWSPHHGDEVIYVLDGRLEADDVMCGPGGVVIVESNVAATVRAAIPTSVVHFGPRSPLAPTDGHLGPADPDGHGLHVLDSHGIQETLAAGAGRSVFYADSDCATCRLTLLRNAAGEGTRTPSHTHSQDELIYLLSGDMQFGRSALGAGAVLAIPAHYRYAFRTETGCEFLNYRSDVSLYTTDPTGPNVLETITALREYMAQGGAEFTRPTAS
jgi:quercetin dioxygenase-like cupin family protein